MIEVTFTEESDLNIIRQFIRIMDEYKKTGNTQTILPSNTTENNDNNSLSSDKPTDKQLYYLDNNNISYNPDTITFNQAFNLIKNHKQGGN